MSRAKYGCASVSNPISALQRDSDTSDDASYDDASMRAMYSDQLAQLENLITRQHVCQQQMREQLIAVEKQYHSVVVCHPVSAVLLLRAVSRSQPIGQPSSLIFMSVPALSDLSAYCT